jgi:hypothetical protein
VLYQTAPQLSLCCPGVGKAFLLRRLPSILLNLISY